MGKGRRRAERGSPGNSGPPERGAGERTNTRRASHGEGKEQSPVFPVSQKRRWGMVLLLIRLFRHSVTRTEGTCRVRWLQLC